MKRVPATQFIKNIGRYLRHAGEGPYVITSHGIDNAVLVSARDFHDLRARAGYAEIPETTPRPLPVRENDPMRRALSIVGTSIRNPPKERDLIEALKGRAGRSNLVTIFFSDVDDMTIAGLVNRGYLTWAELDAALKRAKGVDDEKASFIRGMAEFELDPTARSGTRPSR